MGKKLMSWKTKGMNQDLSVSAFNPEFAFENVNLRLSTNEGNTLLSWVNEKGTEQITNISFDGTPIGTAVINHKLVVFTTGDKDRIYVIQKETEGTYNYTRIYQGNLNFSTGNPLETHVSYEADNIQKVYWTDNSNQPRVINIAKVLDEPIISSSTNVDTRFDFVTSAELDSSITVTKRTSGGTFAPGVIQYCYTYFNKHGQQSCIINVSPLNYLTHTDRGASPEDSVLNSFEITITDPDVNFDMVRLYSIQRTSLDATPYVRAIEDFPTNNGDISYIDTGTSGAVVDPAEMLFLGGKEILALTMNEKDNTLFLGNITQKNSDVSAIQEYFDTIRTDADSSNNVNIAFHNGEQGDPNPKLLNLQDPTGNVYSNTFTLNKNLRQISTFKGGDYYRFGFQLQKYTGEWSEPIFIDDKQNDKYPRTSVFNQNVYLPYAEATIKLGPVAGSINNVYKRIRPVIVYPSIQDRVTICQGVLNPTVFNVQDRKERLPFAQASWYFRPMTVNKRLEEEDNDRVEHDPASPPQSITVPTGAQNYYVIIMRIKDDDTAWKVEKHGLFAKTGDDLSPTYYSIPGVCIRWYDWDGVPDPNNDNKIPPAYIFIVSGAKIMGTETYVAPSKSWTYGTFYGGDFEEVEHGTNNGELLCSANNNSVASRTWPFWNEKVKPNFRLRAVYEGEASDPEEYIFEFILDSGSIKGSSSSGIGHYYCYFYKNATGDRVANIHYESIYAGTSIEDVGGVKTEVEKREGRIVRQIEIQGSVETYENPYAATPMNNSNTQFFVDQSIVTLNSADLEFDSSALLNSAGATKLRIIGAIPITGSASAHRITTSTSMAPLGYESNDSSGNTREGNTFGKGELDEVNTYWLNKQVKSGRRLVSDYMWQDAYLGISVGTLNYTYKKAADYLVHPWQAKRSLTNDTRSNESASSVLKTKAESNLLYSYNSVYFGNNSISPVNIDVDTQYHTVENEFIYNLRLPKQSSDMSEDINYYPNIEKTLVNENPWCIYTRGAKSTKAFTNGVLMKYKSNTHAVIALHPEEGSDDITILPYAIVGATNIGEYTPPSGANETYWEEALTFDQDSIDLHSIFDVDNQYDLLWLGELYKTVDPSTLFGGTGPQALKANKWLVGGEAKDLPANLSNSITLQWTEGDTYYQRYDCLKTYPSSPEDVNQLVEILSFMCETHVNLDGRYDKNRGQIDNTYMIPQNFNLMNAVYNQQDNFFSYRKSDDDKVSKYPNMVTFTKTKESGADIDAWTNITLASNLELDGSRGKISSLQRLDNQLFAFQDTGISQILYNESVQIQSTEGVPIEIANSGKVQGKRYYSNSIGCSNKWSIANTPSGIYFMDSNDKGIYLFNGQLNNLSNKFGFNTWCKKNIFAKRSWNPVSFEDFVTYYDKQNQEILFINENKALAFSEKLGAFTSFYDYGKAPYLCNLDDESFWINKDNFIENSGYYVWKHNKGDYCKFFGVYKPYSMTLVGNPEPQIDKTFTNLELRASIEGDGEYDENTGRFTPILPFNSLEVWDEYQHGYTELKNLRGISSMMHGGNDSALKRKFRIWRCDIPRNNAVLDSNRDPEKEYPYSTDSSLKISRYIRKPLDRMRNPWIYLKLQKNMGEEAAKTEIHDIVMTYFD